MSKERPYVFAAYCVANSLADVTPEQARKLTHLNLAFGVVKENKINIDAIRENRFYLDEIRSWNPDLVITLSTGGGGALSERDYRLVTRAEEQISDPPWFDALKTALMLALVVLMLALPFAPFMLLGKRAGQARALREAFDDADSRRAVCAMFRHIARYWAAYFPVSEGLPFSRLPEAADMPDDYAAAYRACADTFLKAAYSDAPITQAERDGVKILLDETERLLYDEQSALMQLKLRYRYLLR